MITPSFGQVLEISWLGAVKGSDTTGAKLRVVVVERWDSAEYIVAGRKCGEGRWFFGVAVGCRGMVQKCCGGIRSLVLNAG